MVAGRDLLLTLTERNTVSWCAGVNGPVQKKQAVMQERGKSSRATFLINERGGEVVHRCLLGA